MRKSMENQQSKTEKTKIKKNIMQKEAERDKRDKRGNKEKVQK